MASTTISRSELSLLEKHITCSICMEVFKNPVSTTCGHSFCKDCLRFNFEFNDMQCPLCKTHLNRTPDVNIVLRDLVQQFLRDLVQELTKKVDEAAKPGEVGCDVCIEPKRKAKKSCLVCLASYCSTHVKNHHSTERLKGHKLVEPVENLDARACLKHGRPLELYSRKQQKCICVRCMEEGQEEVVSTEDEWDKKKTELENNKTELQDKIKKRKTKVDEITKALKDCKEVLTEECWEVDVVFTAVFAIMEEAQARMLQPLKDRKRVLEREAKDLKDELEAEINKLEKTISELDNISALEDHILFLQSYPSLQDPNNMKDWTEVELDTSLSFGTMRKITTAMLEKVQHELEKLAPIELKRVPTFADVKLDPATAHKRLVVSKDGKQVKDGGEDQDVADGPERFDLFGSVLGLDGFTSGRSYWEVEVTNKTGWDLGVARGDANRKGKLKVNSENGYWATALYEDKKLAALTTPPLRLSLEKKPEEKVGVFVDYDEGLVSFYDVTAQSHIYSFTDCLFRDELYPYFSPHVKQDEKNSEPLIISAVKRS